MQIELYFPNDNYQQKLKNLLSDNTVSIKQNNQNGIYILSIDICGEDESCAKSLSEILEEITTKCPNENFFISKNEASVFFNRQLYPHFNNFERNLRRLIYIIAIKSNDSNMNSIADKIENFDFGEIGNEIIYNKKTVKAYKDQIQNDPNTKFYRRKALADAKDKTLWSFMVEDKTFFVEHFEQLTTYRNDVMHAHNMDYTNYCKALILITGANEELYSLICHYLNQKKYIRPDIEKLLNYITQKMFFNK